MKRLLFILIYTYCFYLYSFTLEKVINLNDGWSIFFLNENNIIITEKNGLIKLFNIKIKSIKNIEHNLNIISSGQGALMDVISYDGKIYVSYSENLPKGSTTSVAKGILKNNLITFNNIFRASPVLQSNYHYGGRLVLISDNIYLTVGDRGKGMIAQDYEKHPGSIIKINKIKTEIDIMMRIGVGASMIRENKIDRNTCDIIKKDINYKLQKLFKKQNYYNAYIYRVTAIK